MPALNQVVVDQIAVTAIGANGQATQLFGQTTHDRKVWLYSPAVGIAISHQPLTRVARGFALPAGQVVQFDLPAGSELYAISGAGTIQVSRYSSAVMSTVGESFAQLMKSLAQKLGIR